MQKLILIVDDHADSREMLFLLLELEGFKAMTAENGYDALKKSKQILPDLILTDLHMPDLNGIEMIKAMRQIPELSNIQVIVLSADEDKRAESMEAGVKCFLTKPVGFDELISTLKQLLECA